MPQAPEGHGSASDVTNALDQLQQVSLAQLALRQQTSPFEPPIQDPPLLPLPSLDPEVFERVAAELISRQDNHGVQFYGRRGQKQYGLDIVERQTSRRRSLYQVKRYSELTKQAVRAAVEEYAGPPRTLEYEGPQRRFSPSRFVVITSAELDRDTQNVDEVAALQDEYENDLDIEFWGAEALSRKLRSHPHLVYAVFGPAWALAFCGYEPSPAAPRAPRPLGLVEDPVAVLGLESLQADAQDAESAEPARAASIYAKIASELQSSGFVGHAALQRRRQATTLRTSGQHSEAFSVLFEAAKQHVLTGNQYTIQNMHRELEELARQSGQPQQDKALLMDLISNWSEQGSNLEASVPALERIIKSNDPDAHLLGCLILEDALVDNLFDFSPPRSIVCSTTDESGELLRQLIQLCTGLDSPDVLLRARLRSAVADATLPLSATPDMVDAAYRALLDDALAGRLLHTRGLVASRAAYAFAVHGAPQRAINLWRHSVIASSEEHYYGDVRGALRASNFIATELGLVETGLEAQVSALPDRKRIVTSASDPALAALDSAHEGKLPDAFGDARRYIRQERLSGHLLDEMLAYTLFGDVLKTAGHEPSAVDAYILAGSEKKATSGAARTTAPNNVEVWWGTGSRHRRAAAIAVVEQQASLFDDGHVDSIVMNLLQEAEGVWEASFFSPIPELNAIKAVAAFGTRIPAEAVDAVLQLAEPATTRPTRISEEIANLLVQTYWAVPDRRGDTAAAIGKMLDLSDPPHNLWELIRNIPEQARGELLPIVRARGDTGRAGAITTLANWGDCARIVQVAARMASAALLRRTVGHPRSVTHVGTQEAETARLVLALLHCEELVDVPAEQLTEKRAWTPGGTLYASITGEVGEADGSAAEASDVSAPTNRAFDYASPANALSDEVDAAAIAASQQPVAVATSAARHLLAIAEDEHQGGASRVSSLSALYKLLSELPGEVALEMTTRLAQLARNPRLTPADEVEIQSNSPLSRFRMNTGAGRVAITALVTAAEAFRAARNNIGHIEISLGFSEFAVAASAALLRGDDPVERRYGALTIFAIVSVDAETRPSLYGLLFHGDEQVRSIAATHSDIDAEMFATLALDPSPRVRAALARRFNELPEQVRATLAADTHLAVRAEIPTEQ